jgi:hypothetical protein
MSFVFLISYPIFTNSIPDHIMCGRKRSLAEFAAPLSPFKYSGPYEYLNDIQSDDDVDAVEESAEQGEATGSAEEKPVEELTVMELSEADWTQERIAKAVCSLPDLVYPAFRDDKICHCKYEGIARCMVPNLPSGIDHDSFHVGEKEASKIASPYSQDNILVCAIMRVASQLVLSDDSLAFWAGIIDCGLGPQRDRWGFRVHPRKHLSDARKAEILLHLENFSQNLRIHFKILTDYETSHGMTSILPAYREDRDFRRDLSENASYAYRNGKTIIEKPDHQFVHITMNASHISGFDQSTDEWQDMTIRRLKRTVFQWAKTLSHEFAHAIMAHYVYRPGHEVEACLNDETLAEAGFSWENFVFGGTPFRNPRRDGPHHTVAQPGISPRIPEAKSEDSDASIPSAANAP